MSFHTEPQHGGEGIVAVCGLLELFDGGQTAAELFFGGKNK
jgi:hypothetical protein